jgi:hypothetical protein
MYTIISSNNRKVGSFDISTGRITTDSESLKAISDLWTSTGIRVHVPPKEKPKPGVMLDGLSIVKLSPATVHIFMLELAYLGYTLEQEKSDPTKSSTKEQEGQTVGDLLSQGDNRSVEEAMEPFKPSDGELIQDPPVTPITDGGVYTRKRKKPTMDISGGQ